MKMFVLAALLAVSATPVLAQTAMKGMPGMAAHNADSGMTSGQGAGVVRAVDRAGATVTIEHGPIAALKWPAMVMKLKANPPSLLKGVSVGQSVKFTVMQMGADAQLTAIKPN